MTSADGNDFVPAQEKLEWVTPKISLMGAGDTFGSGKKLNGGEIATPIHLTVNNNGPS